MKKFITLFTFSFILFSSAIVPLALAATQQWLAWSNEVPRACGSYSSDCDSCGNLRAYKSNTVYRSFSISRGTWLVQASANNIQVQTSCNGWICLTAPDCSVKATKIDIWLTTDEGYTVIHESKIGWWALAEGDGPQSAYETIPPISSAWKEVTCSKDSCEIYYVWTYEIYGYANEGGSPDKYIAGSAVIDATVEYVLGFDFSLSVNPTSGTVVQGNSTTTNVIATLTTGTTKPVSFSYSGLPPGASASFSPTSCSPNCSSTLTISTSTTTPTGSYPITIAATDGVITRTATYTLTVNPKPAFDFSLSVNPTSGTVVQGSGTSANVTVKLLSGDAQSVSLSYSIQPTTTGITVNFNPSSLTPTSTGVNSTMTISTSTTTPTGGYTITVNGTSGSLTRTATYTLTVNPKTVQCTRANPIVAITPPTQSAPAGSTLQYTITVTNTDSGSECTREEFVLSYACPSGWTCSFALPSLSIAPGSNNSTTLNITSPSTASGSNSFSVIATSGSYTGTSSATYVISSPCSGSIILTLIPSTVEPGNSVTPVGSGLSNCDGKKIEFRNESCAGEKIRECIVLASGCSGSPFTAPSTVGSYSYYACIDKNDDGDFTDSGESNSTTLRVAITCSRNNPTVTIDTYEVSKEAGENHTFRITVKNEDYQTCAESTFRLTSDCPSGWSCSFDRTSLTISPGNSVSVNLTVNSTRDARGKYLINLTVTNQVETKYNTTKSISFTITSKCDGASIKIVDASIFENTANITVENNGTANLTITSAVIIDKVGREYRADKLGTLNVGEKKYLYFSNAPRCGNFSKLTVITDCPDVLASSMQVRCLSTEPAAIVKIESVKHENNTVKAVLKNVGSAAIHSKLIKLLLDDEVVECDQTFELAPKTTSKCDISGFQCKDTTAKLKIVEPNQDEKEFNCTKLIKITAKSCRDRECEEPTTIFTKGEKVYLKIATDPDAKVTAVVRHNGESETIDITQPYKPKKAGSYTIELTASKEGYLESTTKIRFVVEAKAGVPVKTILIALLAVSLPAFIYYRLRITKKKESFEKLYEKYRRRSYAELYRKYRRRR